MKTQTLLVLAAALTALPQRKAKAQNADALKAAKRAAECSSCAEWNVAQTPFRIFGNVYYVGTHGLSSILITSPKGDVLIDAGLPESAPLIQDNIRALGYRVTDIKLILNSHDHFDHAGGLADMQKASHATVAVSALSAPVVRAGTSEKNDPQFGVLLPFPPVQRVRTVADGEVLRVGDLKLTAHLTPGHTPGGTTWSWQSCEETRCLDMVYADSQTPVSADGFKFTNNTTYPNVLSDFERGFHVLELLACDILLTPHPDASGFWQRIAKLDAGDPNALVNTNACKSYAATFRARLAARVAAEKGDR